MSYIDFISDTHNKTKRDYLKRVNEFPKAEAAKIAKKFDQEYWDGERMYGYGGYRYDGRWKHLAEKLINQYQLNANSRILDVGCGKGFLLYEISKLIPGIEVQGLDISNYAIENSLLEIKPFLTVGNATHLPYPDKHFDLIISINTLHNLKCYELEKSLNEIERVGKKNKYLVVESFRNEDEKVNLLYWQLTCASFYSPEEWQWWFDKTGYSGDHCFIYFE
jgi:ubiquinone/menaquinone biosynthesis C-methylase UbiE